MTIIVQQKRGNGCIVKGLWFTLVGWWAALIWIGLALTFCLTILGIPIGIWMLNRAGAIAFLD